MAKDKTAEAKVINQLSAVGFGAAQIEALRSIFSPRVDLPKIGLPDADDDESAAKLANATKKRMNKVIGELRA